MTEARVMRNPDSDGIWFYRRAGSPVVQSIKVILADGELWVGGRKDVLVSEMPLGRWVKAEIPVELLDRGGVTRDVR